MGSNAKETVLMKQKISYAIAFVSTQAPVNLRVGQGRAVHPESEFLQEDPFLDTVALKINLRE